MQFNKFIYEDEDYVDENAVPQSIIINNTSGGTVVIQQAPGVLPSVNTIPPNPEMEGPPVDVSQPYYDDENEIQPSIGPPVPDDAHGTSQNEVPSPETDPQIPTEFPMPYDDDYEGPQPIGSGRDDSGMPFYDDESDEQVNEELPPQDVAQLETPPTDPMSGVPVDPNYSPQFATYDDLNGIAAENPERTGEIQQQLDNGTFNSTPGPNEQQPYYEDDPQQIDPTTGQPMAPPVAGPEVDPNMAQAPPEVDPTTGQPMAPAPEVDPATGQPYYEDDPQIDPATGQPMDPAAAGVIDPATGQPMPPQIDPATGQPMDPAAAGAIDPATGQPMPPAGGAIDPMTGMPMDPMAASADPYTSSWTDEKQPEERVGNSSEVTTGRPIPVEDISKISELKKINSQLMRVRGILEKELDKSYNVVEEKLTEAIDYFRTIIANLDSYVNQVDDIIIKYKRFIVTILTQINILKKQEMEDKK